MKNFKLYYREHGCWLEFDEETFLKIRRERQKTYYNRKKVGECFCSKKNLWRCDGMCDTCCYFKSGDMLLSTVINDSEDLTVMGCMSDGGEQERMCLEKIASQEILQYLKGVMPELLEYGKLRLSGKTEQEIAKKWGISRMAIYKKIQKAKKILLEKFGEF